MNKFISLWQTSTVARIFILSFGIIHIPLITLITYVAVGGQLALVPVIAVVLVTTLISSILAFWMVWKLIRPLDELAKALDHYREKGVYPDFKSSGAYRIRRLARGIEEMVEAQEGTIRILRTQANTDALTELGNRRWLDEATEALWQRAQGNGSWLWVILFDVDHFKSINDAHGHAVGDEVLKGIAQIARQQIRPYDMIARVGGEEFCFVIANREAGPALAAAERIRTALANWRPNSMPVAKVTASFGIAGGDPRGLSFDQLFDRADTELYTAKDNGRNVTVFNGAVV